MKKTLSLVTLAILLGLAPVPLRGDDRVDRLSEAHRTWLERDVPYIITEREREVFLSLDTIEERDRFIGAFWKKRDPNPATPENEFRDEHYARLEYANTYLGRDTFREGWQTDRGRYYIILGKPREIQRFEGYRELVPIELWFYQGDPRLGIPSFFYLMFFKRNSIGEFELYNPVIDGPQALLTSSQFLPGSDSRAAIRALREISPELATASLSFDTSDPPDLSGGRPAIGNDIMIARILDSPKRAIRTDYADAWMRYGNRVSAEYSFNFVPSRSSFAVFAEPGGTPLVHYSVELDPDNFALETDEDRSKFYTTLDVSIEARNADDVVVIASDKEVYVELSPSQMQQVQALPFAYQDDFPLVPGDYTVTVIVRNRVVQQYTVAERELHVPDLLASRPALADVVVAFDTRTLADSDAEPGEVMTFQVGSIRIQPAAENTFVIGDTVHLAAQAYGASTEHHVRFELLSGEGVVKTLVSPVEAGGLVIDRLSLDELAGGTYTLRAQLLSPSGESVSEKSVPLTISPRSAATRPGFVLRRGVNTRVPGLVDLIRGEELWNSGRLDEAKAALERSVSANPDLPAARWKLANAYLREENPDGALSMLEPLEESYSQQFEVVAGLGFARYLKGDFAVAVGYLERARQIRPPDPMLLNAIGDCYEHLGNLEEAKKAYEASLALAPEQPPVQQRLQALRSTSGRS